jgi:5,10-methylenetetrahydromethanopterin reductase
VNLGLYVDSSLSIAGPARAAEAAGFSHLWLYDSPLVFGDTSMAALVAAQATSRITIGPGVANPLQRPAEYTAQMIATLEVAAPHRTFLGLGVGNSARRSLGLKPAKLADVAAHTRVVRAMLAGGDALHEEESVPRPVRFIHPDGPWVDPRAVPIWVSAFGPAGQAMAGAVADGVLVRWEGRDTLRDVASGLGAVTRDEGLAEHAQIGVVYAAFPIEHPDELERADVRAALGPLVVSRLRYLTANASSADEVPAAFRDGFEAYRTYRESLDERSRHLDNYRGYLVFTPPDLERFVTPGSMLAVALVGAPERIAEELIEMAESGVDHCSLQMAGDQAAWCERMSSKVFPLLTASGTASGPVEVAA